MAKKSLNLFTILFFTFIFLLNACDTTTDNTEKQEDTKIASPSESTNDNEEKKDETEPRIVGSWQTEEEFNSQKGFSFAYEITADNKITCTMTYIDDVRLSPDEEPIITEGQYMKLIGKVSSVTESVIKVTDMKVSADSTISSDIITQMIGDLSASNSVEIEYKDLTESSVKILQSDIDEEGNEIETWITLVKVGESTENDNTGNNDNNNDNNTEYSIIGSWEFTQTIENTDGTSMEMKVTYVITADKITSYAEVNGQNSTSEMTITKIENGKIYCTGLSPVDNTTEVTSIIVYKDLTANSVKITAVENCEDDVWLTFTKAPYTAIRVEGATSWADYSKEFEEADINEKYSIFEEYATFRELHNDQKAWEEAIKAYEDALVAYEADATDEKEKAMNDARKAVIYTLEDLKNLWDEAFAVLWDKNSNL